MFEALAYAYDHPDEMEAIRQADEAADQRMLDELPKHLRPAAEQIREADDREYQEAVRRAREARLGTPVP